MLKKALNALGITTREDARRVLDITADLTIVCALALAVVTQLRWMSGGADLRYEKLLVCVLLEIVTLEAVALRAVVRGWRNSDAKK